MPGRQGGHIVIVADAVFDIGGKPVDSLRVDISNKTIVGQCLGVDTTLPIPINAGASNLELSHIITDPGQPDLVVSQIKSIF